MEHLKKLSRVSGKSEQKHRQSNLYWMVGLVMSAFLGWFLFSGTSNDKKEKKKISEEFDYTSRTFNQINPPQGKMLEKTGTVIKADVEKEKSEFPKDYLMRQHAPTNMYSASESPDANTFKQKLLDAVGEAQAPSVFSDKTENSVFANQKTNVTVQTAKRIEHGDYSVIAGELIPAFLETAINSDLPGLVRAVTARPVYAYLGARLLIPAGSRLMGQYSAALLEGQNRVMIIWNRIVLPDGVAITLNSPNTDAIGQSGQGADSINTHFLARFGQAALLSIISAGASNVGVSRTDQANAAQSYRKALSESFANSAGESLKNSMNIKPTLKIDQGAKLYIFVAQDLNFYNAFTQKETDQIQ